MWLPHIDGISQPTALWVDEETMLLQNEKGFDGPSVAEFGGRSLGIIEA